MLEFGILGPLQVRRDGLDVTVSAAKPRALLLALLLRARVVVSIDLLVESLWPGQPPPSAAKAVQVYVSQLRATLGAAAIETVDPGYRLCVDEGCIDAERFERLAGEGRIALAGGNAELARALAGRALGLWRGSALAEVAYSPGADHDAARLEDLRLACIEDQLEAELALGGHEAVLAQVTKLCHDHPLRERIRGRLALALYRSGRQADALQVLADGRHLMREELGLDMARELRELEQRILVQDPVLDIWTSPSRQVLPASPSPLIGRHDELERLGRLVLRDDVRIVTISGAGGSGKTRVALELARTIGASFANGVAMVELAAVRDPAFVLPTVAAALKVTETADEPVGEALRRWIGGQELLLVVDNFEHVMPAAAELAALARDAPRLTVLVTSRRVLHVTGEYVFALQPLPADDAVRLFKARATARDRERRFDAEADGLVRAICARVDCLPLAVELAAARAAVLEPRALLDRLTRDISALGVGPRDAPARQQTLSDTVRWSIDLLDDHERRTLGRMSVFAGGCSPNAAEEVCDTDIGTISGLIDASLLRHSSSAVPDRLTMLETVREHAVLLLAPDDRRHVAAAHAAYYAATADATPFNGAHQEDGLRWADLELDNLRAAADRAEAAGDDRTALRIATALYRFWYVRGQLREGRDRIARPLRAGAGAGDPTLQAVALSRLAGLHLIMGELDEAIVAAERGVELGSVAAALQPVMACETVLGLTRTARREFDQARHHLEHSAQLAEQLGSALDAMIANTNLGEVALSAGDLSEAQRRWERTLAWNQGQPGTDDTFAHLGLGAVARRQGRLAEATEHFARASQLAEQNRFPQNMAFAALGLAGVATDQGAYEEAARLLARVDTLLGATGGKLNSEDAADYERTRPLSWPRAAQARSALAPTAGPDLGNPGGDPVREAREALHTRV